MSETRRPIIFFDGVCNLCNGFVDFVVRADTKEQFYLASLQGETARQRLPEELRREPLSSVVLWTPSSIERESEAVLTVLAMLPLPWKLARAAKILPQALRDSLYRLTAENRYRLFGRRESCRVPTLEERARFLD